MGPLRALFLACMLSKGKKQASNKIEMKFYIISFVAIRSIIVATFMGFSFSFTHFILTLRHFVPCRERICDIGKSRTRATFDIVVWARDYNGLNSLYAAIIYVNVEDLKLN